MPTPHILAAIKMVPGSRQKENVKWLQNVTGVCFRVTSGQENMSQVTCIAPDAFGDRVVNVASEGAPVALQYGLNEWVDLFPVFQHIHA